MTDSNQNITRKFDLNRNKIKLKIDFDSSLTCYNLDPKSNRISRIQHIKKKILKNKQNGVELFLK
jgi:hypothetical protein